MTTDRNKNWYVLKTKMRSEKKVLQRLLDQEVEAYLPLKTSLKQWSDRKKKVHEPLIAMTIFVKCASTDLAKMYQVQGVVACLKYLGKPAIVKENEIDLLKQYCEKGFQESDVSFTLGDFVDVNQGPLVGLSGQVVKGKGKHKIKIRIDSLGMNCTVDIPKSFVKKIKAVA